jgi:hypothetical protein
MSSFFSEIRKPSINQISQIYYIKTLQNRLSSNLTDNFTVKYYPDNYTSVVSPNIIDKCKRLLHRDAWYLDKHLSQEVSIITNLQKIIKYGDKQNIILDVGGGNGCLAYLCGKILEIPAIVVDRKKPDKSVDHNTDLDFTYYRRIVTDLKDFNIGEFANYNVYIIAKHLCGTGLDIVIRFIIENTSLIAGFVLAPCCYNKGTYYEPMYGNFLTNSEWDTLSKVTEYKSYKMISTPYFKLGCDSENILNNIRMYYLEKYYTLRYVQYTNVQLTPKNLLIIGNR